MSGRRQIQTGAAGLAPPTGPYPGNYDLEAPMDELACAGSPVSGLPAGNLDDLRDGVTLCEL